MRLKDIEWALAHATQEMNKQWDRQNVGEYIRARAYLAEVRKIHLEALRQGEIK